MTKLQNHQLEEDISKEDYVDTFEEQNINRSISELYDDNEYLSDTEFEANYETQ